jgi:hypothetical protein
VGIRKPTADWNSMLWMENVRCWRVVDDDSLPEVPADLRQIFDVVSLVVVATLTEKAVMYNMMDI